jgi:hypothetical protein
MHASLTLQLYWAAHAQGWGEATCVVDSPLPLGMCCPCIILSLDHYHHQSHEHQVNVYFISIIDSDVRENVNTACLIIKLNQNHVL